MKHLILLLLMVLMTSFTNENFETKFEKGFNEGYESGWCYQEPNCVAPSPPSAPTPNVNESSNSYQDGYNRGFTKGKKDKKMSKEEKLEQLEKTIQSHDTYLNPEMMLALNAKYRELQEN